MACCLPKTSHLGHTTVNEELDTCNVARFIRCQKHDGASDLLVLSNASHRNLTFHEFRESLNAILAQECAVCGRDNDARANGVDADAASFEIARPGAGERPDRRLGRAVHAEVLHALDRTGRGVQYDRATLLHQWQGFLDGEERALHIRIELPVKLFLGDLTKPRKTSAAGVREQNIQPALLPLDLGVEAVKIFEVRNVALYARCTGTNRTYGFIKLSRAASGHVDGRPFLCEPLRGGQTDAATAAGHDCNLAFQSVSHSPSPLQISALLARSI